MFTLRDARNRHVQMWKYALWVTDKGYCAVDKDEEEYFNKLKY